ncbi:MAG: hypothetical protein WCR52_20255 [Bacteroidota bacterium]
MKRNIYTTLFLLLFTISTLSAQEKVDRNLLLKHHIGEMRIYSHLIQAGKATSDSSLYYVYKYDEKGNLIVNTRIAPGGSFCYKYESYYQQDTFKVKTLGYKSEGVLETQFDYKHDGNGNLVYTKQTSLRPDDKSKPLENFLVYNDKNQYTEAYMDYGAGKHIVAQNTYDDKGNCIKTINMLPDGKPYKTTTTVYNEQNQPVKTYSITEKKKKKQKNLISEMIYDTQGRIAVRKVRINQSATFSIDGFDRKAKKGDRTEMRYRYDARSFLAEKSYFVNSVLFFKLTYSYSVPSPNVSKE